MHCGLFLSGFDCVRGRAYSSVCASVGLIVVQVRGVWVFKPSRREHLVLDGPAAVAGVMLRWILAVGKGAVPFGHGPRRGFVAAVLGGPPPCGRG